ncbi:unnamed protein product [Meganyctiphanes norvegica]|uniref:Uncharacterized protein n=1 Tax=Meganyctiphanes norvegica TaxID=48144 RepID=A0AAV2SCL3_MEGNR
MDTKATTKLATKEGKLHLHNFKPEIPEEETTTVQLSKVLSHLPVQPPSLIFLDLTYPGRGYQGRVYIRLQPELQGFVRQIPTLLTGDKGHSILGNTCWGGAVDGLWVRIDKPVNNFAAREADVTAKSGDVICWISGNDKNHSISDIGVYMGAGTTFPPNECAKIGIVETGLEVARECSGLGRWQQDISISDCGVVLEM